MAIDIEDEVSRALDELAASVNIRGPITTSNHTNYVVEGLADEMEQMTNLSWCILGYIGRIIEADLRIDSAIGEGSTARDNLINTLQVRLRVGETLTARQIERNRDPLLQELISHVLLMVHQRQDKLPEWLGEVRACRPPHLSANDPGLDLIAIGADQESAFPIIGEIKAYETDPIGGFATACTKFTQVRNGEYDDEIRQALKSMNADGSFTRQQLADSVWAEQGRFGALVGHDVEHSCNDDECCERDEVTKQAPDRLFFITSPFNSMRELFDAIVENLVDLAKQLGD